MNVRKLSVPAARAAPLAPEDVDARLAAELADPVAEAIGALEWQEGKHCAACGSALVRFAPTFNGGMLAHCLDCFAAWEV